MIVFWLAPCLGCITNLILAAYVWRQNPQQRLNQVYGLWGVALAIWCGGVTALSFITSEPVAFIAARILHAGVIWVPITGLHVCLLIAGANYPRLLRFGYLAAGALSLLNFAGLYIQGVNLRPYGWIAIGGIGFQAFTVYMPIITGPAFFSLLRRRREVPARQKRRFSILFTANCVIVAAGLHDLISVYGVQNYPGTGILIYPWGSFGACIYSLLVAWAVLHEQLLEVRVALSRNAAQLIRLLFLVTFAFLLLFMLVLASPAGDFSIYAAVSALGVILASAVVTGIFFPKLLGKLDVRMAHRLLGDQFEYHEQIAAVTAVLHDRKTSDELWREVSDVLCTGMKVRSAHLLLLAARPFVVELKGERSLDGPKIAYAALGAECSLLRFFALESCRWLAVIDPVFPHGDQIRDDAHQEALSLGADHVFSIPGSNRCCGFLAVGDKINGDPITRYDVELLAVMAERIGWISERIVFAKQAVLTDQLEAQALMTKGLAHDINNLLTSVSTIVQLHARRYAAEDLSTEAALHRNAWHNLKVIRDYLDEALYFAIDLQMQRAPTRLTDLLDGTKTAVGNRAESRGVLLEFRADDASSMLDSVLMQRVLANLVSNAVDASPSGKTVTVDARGIPSRNVVQFTVRDEGCGIPTENLQKIYLPHFTTKDVGDNTRGFGLGLWIVQRIVKIADGAINVTSTVGQGTQFTVELPYLKVPSQK